MQYLLNEEQRKFVQEVFNENQKKADNIKKERYNPDNVFKNKRQLSIEEEKHISSMIAVKEVKWYQKIFKLIKKKIYKLKDI